MNGRNNYQYYNSDYLFRNNRNFKPPFYDRYLQNRFKNNQMRFRKNFNQNYARTNFRRNNNKQRNKVNNKQFKRNQKQTNNFIKTIIPTVKSNNNTTIRKKEVRKDRLYSAIEMYRTSRYISIYPSSSAFKYITVYSKFHVNSGLQNRNVYLFPYFTVMDGAYKSITVNNQSCDTATNAYWVTADNVINPLSVGKTGLVGNYRTVTVSYKITNLTAFNSRSGSYTVYKLNDPNIFPIIYNAEYGIGTINDMAWKQSLYDINLSNKDQLSNKRTYSCNEICGINEYNIHEGNNVFQKPIEYLGCLFENSVFKIATCDMNVNGVNIVYNIEIANTTSTQDYLVESWQVIEVIPDPLTNLSAIAEKQKYVYDKSVIDKMRNADNLIKYKN